VQPNPIPDGQKATEMLQLDDKSSETTETIATSLVLYTYEYSVAMLQKLRPTQQMLYQPA
jgi:hypothetical protein